MTDIEATRQLTRGEAADYLREFADQLDDRDSDPLSAGLYDTDSTSETSTDPATDASASTTDSSSTGGTMDPSSADATTDTASGDRETQESLDDPTTAADGRVTFLVGNDSATINPPKEVGFAVEVGNDDSLVTNETEQHVTFDLTWHAEDVDDRDTLDIE